MIQAHDPTRQHKDISVGQCLCAGHHADKHPELPRALFFSVERNQPLWNNISAASIGRELKVGSRSVVKAARKLNIQQGILSDGDKQRLVAKLKINLDRKAKKATYQTKEWGEALIYSPAKEVMKW